MVAPEFSWESFRKNESSPNVNMLEKPNMSQQQTKEEPKDFSWGNFKTTSTYQGEPDPTADESTLSWLARNVVSNVARGAEAIAGRYGNLQKFGENLLVKIPESTGILGKAIHALVGEDKWEQMIRGPENQPGLKGPRLPTSEDLRQVTEAITGDYTKPKTKGERRSQEVSSDVASVAGGKGSLTTGSVNRRLINNLGIPAAANAAKGTVEDLGFGKEKGEWSKMAAWLSLSLMGNVDATTFASNLMNEGRSGFGSNVSANVPRYEGRLNQIARNMLQSDPRSALAQQQIAGIKNDIANGQTSMRDLMNRYDALNAAKRDRGLFQLGRTDRAAATRNIDQVRDVVREEIMHLGQSNPAALRSWEDGVRAFSVIHRSNAITNMVQEVASGPYAKILAGPAAALFAGSAAAIAKAPAIGSGLAIGGAAAVKTLQVAMRVYGDPNLARYYWTALNAARQQNEHAFIKNINHLNTIYEKKYGND
jgi:hypothetical protein